MLLAPLFFGWFVLEDGGAGPPNGERPLSWEGLRTLFPTCISVMTWVSYEEDKAVVEQWAAAEQEEELRCCCCCNLFLRRELMDIWLGCIWFLWLRLMSSERGHEDDDMVVL